MGEQDMNRDSSKDSEKSIQIILNIMLYFKNTIFIIGSDD